ncbi:LysM peptidoglycan-binding domain-containing protein [Cellulomonas bogoriensis]|uniref:LysM domain-containing protein n=1 Tax=Cellulomonas bogoriensis 69B4 = DSM 16987 TaxID=1386082 RepID=A0A0A0BZF2_9CELL|nr:LysM peptidoglycan-binding domain-containing protein [Cellulomonas bogoriensis]KGM13315.1 hypothetical protein N869_14935 [Cellulomonas bogoriensis 69B4 = DSM 16987]
MFDVQVFEQEVGVVNGMSVSVRARSGQQCEVPLRLTARGRVVVWLLATLVAAGVGLGAQSATAGTPAEPQEVRAHTVVAGETLWDIARSATPAGGDVRDVVADVVRTNDLPSAAIVPGQRLVVPLPADADA